MLIVCLFVCACVAFLHSYLQGNPLFCDCRLLWLVTAIKWGLNSDLFDDYFYDDTIAEDQREHSYPEEEILCAGPAEYQDKKVEDTVNGRYCGE